MSRCPDEHELADLLARPYDEAAWETVQQHLEACSRCRSKLETLAGAETLVPPASGYWQVQKGSSPSLARAMHALQSDPERETAVPLHSVAVGQDRQARDVQSPAKKTPKEESVANSLLVAARAAGLRSTDREGFLGRLGNFDVRRVIGQGGMGLVLEAVDPVLKRTVALKMLSPWRALDAETKERFLREAQSAASLAHENVVGIFAVEEDGSTPFLVLEYVAGQSLQDRIRVGGKLPPEEVARVGAQIARGLAAAHGQGLVHRDIKPANILLVERSGRVKIADFGLAKVSGEDALTLDGMVLGTPEFMSPEQAAGKRADERSDLFSLGGVLYFAASGVSPFRSESLLGTLERVKQCQPRSLTELEPALPTELRELIQRLMQRDPAARPAAAGEVAEVLERIAGVRSLDSSSGVSAASATKQSAQPTSLWRTLALAGIAATLLIGLGIWLGRGREPSPDSNATSTTSSQPNVAPPATHLKQVGFAIVGRDDSFGKLAEAVAAASDNDIVEVHGDGPYLTAPLAINDKRLTIRAAPGSLPVLLTEVPGGRATAPLFRADRDLRLEGLEIRWAIEGQPRLTEAEMLARSVVSATGGRLLLAHCRIVSDRLSGCVAASGGDVIAYRSQFTSRDGMGIYWRPRAGSRLHLEGCQLENRFGLAIVVDEAAGGERPASIRFDGNLLMADRALQMLVDNIPRNPLPFVAQNNVFSADFFVVMMGQRTLPRGKAGSKVDEGAPVLRGSVAWSERGNVYRSAMEFVGRPIGRPMPGRLDNIHSADVKGVAKWLELWNLPAEASIEGEIEFKPRSESLSGEPLGVAGVKSPSGPLPAKLGPNASEMGPGKAYESWRNSPEFAAWPPAAE